MSAFVVSTAHLDYLVAACREYDSYAARDLDRDALGALLLAENVASVNHRYPTHPAVAPAPYRFTPPDREVEPVQVIKAAECLRYQSCEHPGWRSSRAAKIVDELISRAINCLPGYEEADWDIAA